MDKITPFACDMSAFSPEERARHVASIRALFARVLQVREIQEGYEFSFASTPDALTEMAEFVSNEQRCCPFFTFILRVDPVPAPLVLQIAGPPGVKPFILAEFGGALPTSVRSLTLLAGDPGPS